MNRIISTFLRKLTFQRQLSITVTFGILFLALFSSLVGSWQSNERTRRNLIEQGQRITENLARQSALALIYASSDNATGAANATLAFPGVIRVEIRDINQRVLLGLGSAQPTQFSARTSLTGGAAKADGAQTAAVLDAEGPKAWRFTASVYSQPAAESPFLAQASAPELLGHVAVVMSKAELTQATTDIFITNLTTSFSFALLFLVMIRFLTNRMTQPFIQLSASMGLAEAGESQVRAVLAGPKDIADMAHAFNSMMSVLEEREAALRVAATAFESEEGMLVTDEKTVIVRVNRAFTQLTGYSAEEAIGKTPAMLKSGRHDAEFYAHIWECLQRDNHWQGEIWNQRKNGEIYPEWLNISAVLGVNGKVINYVGAFLDITERKLAELELKRHRDHLQELVDERTLALLKSETEAHRALAELKHQKFVLDQHAIVAVTDVQGRITYVNDKFCAISGYTRDELLGQDHSLLNSGHHANEFFEEMYRSIVKGRPWHREICNRAKDGRLYWVDTTIATFMGDDGKPQEYIAISTDTTERKLAEQSAAAANRAKSEFLANMSHEIRTPMNGVVGMVDVLQESKLSREQRRMVGIIRDSSLALLGILNDILDFSKIEAGKLDFEIVPTNLRELVEGVAELMAPKAASKELDLMVFVPPDAPCWILTDPSRLRQILLNLLGNAVKFTSNLEDRRGQVVLRVETTPLSDGRDGLHLSIIDNGIGMTPKAVTQLFQPFTQADESTTRRFGGTGLGLSISKRLVELLQGQILVSSMEGMGTKFTVELPLEIGSTSHAVVSLPELTEVSVLLVTSNPVNAEILSAYLHFVGAKTKIVVNQEAARKEILQTGKMGWVVLLDLTHEADAEAYSGKEMGDADVIPPIVPLLSRRNYFRLSDELIVSANPILFGDIVRTVALAAGRITIQESVGQTERRTRPRSMVTTVEEAMTSGRLILLAEDNETNREVIQEQLRLLSYASEVAVDGLDALEKWRSGRYALLLTDCHMPKMDGFQLTAAIRSEEPQGKRLSIIAITANAMEGESKRCLDCGMDGYLTKPLRLDKLGSMLAKWLPPLEERDGASPNAAVSPLVQAKDTHASAVVWDATALARMVGDNPAMHRRLLDKFLVTSETQVAAIDAAVAAGDVTVVFEVAHKLKSAARTVGALLLGELCQDMETAGRAGDMQAIRTLSTRLTATFHDAAEQIGRA